MSVVVEMVAPASDLWNHLILTLISGRYSHLWTGVEVNKMIAYLLRLPDHKSAVGFHVGECLLLLLYVIVAPYIK